MRFPIEAVTRPKAGLEARAARKLKIALILLSKKKKKVKMFKLPTNGPIMKNEGENKEPSGYGEPNYSLSIHV